MKLVDGNSCLRIFIDTVGNLCNMSFFSSSLSKDTDHFTGVVMHPTLNPNHAKMYDKRKRVQCFEYFT